MYIEQIYTKCLSEATYYIESNGFAAVIDPLREVQPYLDLARSRGAEIIYVFETHFHADFVSGHIDLSNKTDAIIVFGPTTLKTGFPAVIAKDGQVFQLGDVTIQLIHTPGHTMESSCYLLKSDNKPVALFTGDTLFIGDVGRPDLAQKVIAELTPQKLAGHLFDSLRNKIMPLPDDLIICPGHGAGSACGKNMSKETTDTLGHQKKVNYALNTSLNKEEFIRQVLTGLTQPPAYFPQDVLLNVKGYASIDHVFQRSLKPLVTDEFKKMIETTELVILDTRDAQTFAQGFVPGSVNIGIDGSFATWAGTLIKDTTTSIVFVAYPGREEEVVTRLARIGFDTILGYLDKGFESWKNSGLPVEKISSIEPALFSTLLKNSDTNIIDARNQKEFEEGHLPGAKNLPLEYMEEHEEEINKDKVTFVYCAGGYRSMAFISLLKRKGYNNLVDVKGGFAAIKQTAGFGDQISNETDARTFCEITKENKQLNTNREV
ncbi:MBL fold metallo-hydrolase [Sphingobacteriaceae bacterium]|nr:MBL fold metallo-hydrolase [Sphingobacteriaceae bacterium]